MLEGPSVTAVDLDEMVVLLLMGDLEVEVVVVVVVSEEEEEVVALEIVGDVEVSEEVDEEVDLIDSGK